MVWSVNPIRRAVVPIASGVLLLVLAIQLHGAREMTHVAASQKSGIDRFVTRRIEPLSGHTTILSSFRWSSEVFVLLTVAVLIGVATATEVRARLPGVAATIAVTYLVSDLVMKPLVDRRIVVPNVYRGPPTFPSGHAALVWAAAFAVSGLRPVIRPVSGAAMHAATGPRRAGRQADFHSNRHALPVGAFALSASVLIVLSLSHFLTDVLGGMLLALFISSSISMVTFGSPHHRQKHTADITRK